MSSSVDLAYAAMAVHNRKLQRWFTRGVMAAALAGVALGIVATAMLIGDLTTSDVYSFRGWWLPAAAIFTGVTLTCVFIGVRVLRFALARAQLHGIERIARECGISEEEVAELAPPAGDSTTIVKRKLRVRPSSPKDRSPLRWP